MKVSLWRSSGLIGTEWYAFHTSRTLFLVFAGTSDASIKGDRVWCVCRLDASFRALKSTVRLGVPSCFGTTTIRAHQVVGVLIGTGSMMPNATYQSKSSFTLLTQCNGTGMGVCTAVGTTSASVTIGIGSPCILGRGCLVHLLNDDAE